MRVGDLNKNNKKTCKNKISKIDSALPSSIKNELEKISSILKENKIDPSKYKNRWQDKKIIELVAANSKVLDLGCGEGKLLSSLIKQKKVFAQGIELDYKKVLSCIKKGVCVLHGDIDSDLDAFNKDSFDYVIAEETLQTLQDPATTISKMLKIGKRAIVSFPNFAYYKVRLDLFLRGKMPVTSYLPFRWYNTPNIHLFTYCDFLDFASENNFLIEEGYALCGEEILPIGEKTNFEAEELLLVIKKR